MLSLAPCGLAPGLFRPGVFFAQNTQKQGKRGFFFPYSKSCLLTIRKPLRVTDSQLSWRVFSLAASRFSLSRNEFYRLDFTNLAIFRQNVLAELLTLGSFVLFSPFTHLYTSYANHQSARSQRPPQGSREVQVTSLGRQSVSSWRLHASNDAHTEEAEFRYP